LILQDDIDENYMCRCFQDGLRYELQDVVVPLGIRHFQVLVEKCQKIEDMRNKRVSRQGNFSVGGPIRPSNQNQYQNRGRQGNKPYNRPQNNRGTYSLYKPWDTRKLGWREATLLQVC
jgi:hypothetical protein